MLTVQREAFLEEARELLTDLEHSLLRLEETPDDLELVRQVFRTMHTIKGSGAMFGFEAASAFTHEVETVYDLVRDAIVPVTGALIDLSLQSRDHILALLENESTVDGERTQELIEAFRRFLPDSGDAGKPGPSGEKPSTPGAGEGAENKTYRIRFRPSPEIFLSGTNPLHLLREIQDLGQCRIVAQVETLPPLGEIDPERCYVYWDILLTTAAGENAIRDVFIFVEDDSEIVIEPLGNEGEACSLDRLGDILVAHGAISVEMLESALAKQKRLGNILLEEKLITEEQLNSALDEQRKIREQSQSRVDQEAASTIRVPTDRLDRLVDLIGELVTVRSRLSSSAAILQDPELMTIAEEVERLTEDLRNSTLNIRMLPIGTTFSRFKRLVRDLAADLGKEIELVTMGGETELDKTVIEKLNDPLVHIIRNSIDHGIETPGKRLESGKPRRGTVHLAAAHSGDSVIIEIRDDGKGLDREAIFAKAVEKGLVAQDAQLADRDVFDLVFAPGFSTAKNVTSVSGRGVGMDVVKRAIEALRGNVDIESRPGQGTVIRVKIPLTLAIIDCLLVTIGPDRFLLPLNLVEECIELDRKAVAETHGRHLIKVRGQIISYIPLRQSFEIDGQRPPIEQIVITNVNGSRMGFVVDQVVGEHQTVIKSLGRVYRDVQGISGATILGDGRVALIIDIPHLIQAAEAEERKRLNGGAPSAFEQRTAAEQHMPGGR